MPRRRSKKNHKGGVLYEEGTATPAANQSSVLDRLNTGINDIGVAGRGVVQGATRMATEAKNAAKQVQAARVDAHQKKQAQRMFPVSGGRRKKRKSRKKKRKSRKKKRRTKRRRKSRRIRRR